MDYKALIKSAEGAREKAYAPYSGFKVGAALLAADGTVYTGCNVENASFGATICAERTAFTKAVSEGSHSFKAIAIVGGAENDDKECPPCGICRQFMSEFCGSDFQIVLKSGNEYKIFTLGGLLPSAFEGENL